METAAKDSFTIRSVGILRFDVCTNWKAIDEMHVPIFGTLANATFKCVQRRDKLLMCKLKKILCTIIVKRELSICCSQSRQKINYVRPIEWGEKREMKVSRIVLLWLF